MTDTRRQTSLRRSSDATASDQLELPRTTSIVNLIIDGRDIEASVRHSEHLDEQLRRAARGERINLTDLIAAKEELDLDGSDVSDEHDQRTY